MKNRFTFFLAALCVGLAEQALAQTPGVAQLEPTSLTGNQTTGGTFFITAGNGRDAASHMKFGGPNSWDHGTVYFMAGYKANNPTNTSYIFNTRPNNDNDYVAAMRILQNGQVRIGQQAPTGTNLTNYKLAVDGQLVAKSMYVTTQSWADFVFEPTYKPMSLPALETYLKQNKHLPAIPAAKEVIDNGINVAEMNVKLLQTVEELTLHVIELGKQNQRLQANMADLQKQVKAGTGK